MSCEVYYFRIASTDEGRLELRYSGEGPDKSHVRLVASAPGTEKDRRWLEVFLFDLECRFLSGGRLGDSGCVSAEDWKFFSSMLKGIDFSHIPKREKSCDSAVFAAG